ncbi:hypothetical protein [Anaerobiospirillum succiniciproducens]|uniref:hypothetical protein n=1 Tax=Anaerobiospirillum succiniciproducens TaxID=13335 RepID=UPI002354C45A|nr:hypothetical protein [Anaerobiospirillum succiniciproducens]MCI6864502.1 hypothetical protein [Anaerobiospirillum succiniciproducens]
MDFVISDDGELLSYSGLGGSVVIPEGVKFIARDGVFDPQVRQENKGSTSQSKHAILA